MKTQTINRIALFFSAAVILYCLGFVLTHEHIVLNRYVDSWWHISVADEFAQTGVFAKDPFFENAPPFAQFGLMDYVNGRLAVLTGYSTDVIFPKLVAFNVIITLLAAFFSGWLLNRRSPEGCAAMLVWLIAHGRHNIIGMGYPFATGISLVMLLFSFLWSQRNEKEYEVESRKYGNEEHTQEKPQKRRGILFGTTFDLSTFRHSTLCSVSIGLLAGGIFVLHVFTGLIAVACVMSFYCWIALALLWKKKAKALPSVILGSVISATAFLLISWRWIVMHIELRPILKTLNAHNSLGVKMEMPFLVMLASVTVLILLLLILLKESRKKILPYSIFSLILLILCLPFVNNILAEITSAYMANRIPLFAPVGIAAALTVSGWLAPHRARHYKVLFPATILLLSISLYSLKTFLPFHVWMWRTDNFDNHKYSFLDDLRGVIPAESVVVSDPETSYFVRGMLGNKVVTVMPGVASPAVDYAECNKAAADCIKNGITSGQVLLFTRKSKAGARFFGVTESDYRKVLVSDNKVLKDLPEVLVVTGN